MSVNVAIEIYVGAVEEVAEFEEKHAVVLELLAELRKARASAEKTARNEILSAYTAGEELPRTAAIQMRKIVEVDVVEAIAWAIDNGQMQAVQLDSKAYKKVLEASDNVSFSVTPPGVLVEKPTAVIKKKELGI